MVKRKYHLVILLLLFALLTRPLTLDSGSSVQAQGAECLPGLDAETCALLGSAFANTSTPFVIDYSFVVVTGEAAMTIKGGGPMDIDKASAMGGGAAASADDPGAALNGLTLQQTITVSGMIDGEEVDDSYELRIVDGSAYFKIEADDEWHALNLAETLSELQAFGMTPVELQSAQMQIFSILMLPEMQELLADPSRFLAVEVSDGGAIDGVSTQKITLNIDLAALGVVLGSDDARPLLTAVAGMLGEDGSSWQSLRDMVRSYQPMLDSSSTSISWWIDPAAKQLRGVGLNIALTLDAAAHMAMGMAMGMDGFEDDSDTALTDQPLKIDFQVTFSKIGEPITVEPVEPAAVAE